MKKVVREKIIDWAESLDVIKVTGIVNWIKNRLSEGNLKLKGKEALFDDQFEEFSINIPDE